MRRLFLLAAFIVVASPLPAQKAQSIAKAVETITAEDVARHIGVIADDSMEGRNTPSPGLDRAARYVADQFKKFGLKPGEKGAWIYRYPFRQRFDFARSRVVFAAAGKEASAGFTTAARLATRRMPDQPATAGIVVVNGRHRLKELQETAVRDKIVLYVQSTGVDSATQAAIRDKIFPVTKGMIILSDLDSVEYGKRLQTALQDSTVGLGNVWAVVVRPEAVPGLIDVLAAGGLDLAQARADTTPVIRELPKLAARLEAKRSDILTAPNVVGILEGSDPKLKNEYIVFSAHLDHIGIRSTPGQTDSINNGADDNASGVAGLLELAEAFRQPGARPRRSLIFLAVSGEEKGLMGSKHFLQRPPVPFEQLVANVNMDMIGRSRGDTVVVDDGAEGESYFGGIVKRVTSAHPELRLNVPVTSSPGATDFMSFQDKGVPFLDFHTGIWHSDYHGPTDTAEKINADAEARILRLAFYVSQEIANADQRPK